jgi:hypothetical protein
MRLSPAGEKSVCKRSFSAIYLLLTCANERFESDDEASGKSLPFFQLPQSNTKSSGDTPAALIASHQLLSLLILGSVTSEYFSLGAMAYQFLAA